MTSINLSIAAADLDQLVRFEDTPNGQKVIASIADQFSILVEADIIKSVLELMQCSKDQASQQIKH